METRYRLTEKFLKTISSRLSGRSDCRRVNYLVYIGRDPIDNWKVSDNDLRDPTNYVFFIPNRYVYPNVHKKSDIDKRPIIDHVILTYFKQQLFNGYDEYGKLRVYTKNLIPGVYEYESSVNGKSRRWVKVYS